MEGNQDQALSAVVRSAGGSPAVAKPDTLETLQRFVNEMAVAAQVANSFWQANMKSGFRTPEQLAMAIHMVASEGLSPHLVRETYAVSKKDDETEASIKIMPYGATAIAMMMVHPLYSWHRFDKEVGPDGKVRLLTLRFGLKNGVEDAISITYEAAQALATKGSSVNPVWGKDHEGLMIGKVVVRALKRYLPSGAAAMAPDEYDEMAAAGEIQDGRIGMALPQSIMPAAQAAALLNAASDDEKQEEPERSAADPQTTRAEYFAANIIPMCGTKVKAVSLLTSASADALKAALLQLPDGNFGGPEHKAKWASKDAAFWDKMFGEGVSRLMQEEPVKQALAKLTAK